MNVLIAALVQISTRANGKRALEFKGASALLQQMQSNQRKAAPNSTSDYRNLPPNNNQ